MKYALTNFDYVTTPDGSYFAGPAGAIGLIDLGTVPEMQVAGSPRKGCLFWLPDASPLPSGAALLGSGDCREIDRTAKMVSVFQSKLGYRPDGDHLHEMILDCLIGGADPDGQSAPRPIVPNTDGWMELHLPGHGSSHVKGERFEWGRTPHTTKVKQLLRKQFAELMDAAVAGKLADPNKHRRVLDDWCLKYGVSDWKEFVSLDRQKDVPGRLERQTSYTETFTKANGAGLTADLTWSDVDGNWSTTSNQAYCSTAGAAAGNLRGFTRAEHDVSSSDHYSQCSVTALGAFSTRRRGPTCRMNSSNQECYAGHLMGDGNVALIYNGSTGTETLLSSTAFTLALPNVVRTYANGSSIKVFIDGVEKLSVTNTSLSSGLRGGMCNGTTADTNQRSDDWSIADIAGGSGITIVQLVSTTRGVTRAVRTKW